MARILVLYYSSYGHIAKMADARVAEVTEQGADSSGPVVVVDD